MGKMRALGWIAMAGCSVGAPPGFSSGDHWTFPLVGPLEDGLLITPATVKGHGPYLFAIDPDANISAVDKQIVDDADLRTSAGPRIIDETEHGQTRLYAELLGLQVAGLKVERRSVLLFPVGYYDTEQRHINGILGRDVIADSLVFGFDRDQGVAMLSTGAAFTAPPDAIAIAYEELSGDSGEVSGKYPEGRIGMRGTGQHGGFVEPYGDNVPSRINESDRQGLVRNDVLPVPRRLATAQIGGAKLRMHLDLGAKVSQLPESRWSGAHLTQVDTRIRLVDEAASVRYVTHVGVAAEVTAGPVKAQRVTFAPFIDQRFPDRTIDGALGLDFFRGYAVYANWHKQTYYLKPRGDAAAAATARLGRWGAALPACPDPGCVTARLVTVDGGPVVELTRDREASDRGLEVVLAATPPAGASVASLIVELPRGVDRYSGPLGRDYANAHLQVVDVAPFPRACPGEGGCVFVVGDVVDAAAEALPEAARQQPSLPAAPPPDARPADPASADARPAEAPAEPPRNVPLDKLHRLSGDAAIPPNVDVRRAAGDRTLATAIVRLCLAPDGSVESTRVLKSSGVPVYDDQLQSTIRSSWKFSPVDPDKPGRVCTSVTFATPH